MTDLLTPEHLAGARLWVDDQEAKSAATLKRLRAESDTKRYNASRVDSLRDMQVMCQTILALIDEREHAIAEVTSANPALSAFACLLRASYTESEMPDGDRDAMRDLAVKGRVHLDRLRAENEQLRATVAAGRQAIDGIDHALWSSCHAFRHTDDWDDPYEYDGCDGQTPRQWILNAFKNARIALDALTVELSAEAQQEIVEHYMQAGARFCVPSFDLARFHADGFAIVRVRHPNHALPLDDRAAFAAAMVESAITTSPLGGVGSVRRERGSSSMTVEQYSDAHDRDCVIEITCRVINDKTKPQAVEAACDHEVCELCGRAGCPTWDCESCGVGGCRP